MTSPSKFAFAVQLQERHKPKLLLPTVTGLSEGTPLKHFTSLSPFKSFLWPQTAQRRPLMDKLISVGNSTPTFHWYAEHTFRSSLTVYEFLAILTVKKTDRQWKSPLDVAAKRGSLPFD
jgi:hypothetical protein